MELDRAGGWVQRVSGHLEGIGGEMGVLRFRGLGAGYGVGAGCC